MDIKNRARWKVALFLTLSNILVICYTYFSWCVQYPKTPSPQLFIVFLIGTCLLWGQVIYGVVKVLGNKKEFNEHEE
jgi:hypothetical protein